MNIFEFSAIVLGGIILTLCVGIGVGQIWGFAFLGCMLTIGACISMIMNYLNKEFIQ